MVQTVPDAQNNKRIRKMTSFVRACDAYPIFLSQSQQSATMFRVALQISAFFVGTTISRKCFMTQHDCMSPVSTQLPLFSEGVLIIFAGASLCYAVFFSRNLECIWMHTVQRMSFLTLCACSRSLPSSASPTAGLRATRRCWVVALCTTRPRIRFTTSLPFSCAAHS